MSDTISSDIPYPGSYSPVLVNLDIRTPGVQTPISVTCCHTRRGFFSRFDFTLCGSLVEGHALLDAMTDSLSIPCRDDLGS